VRFRLKPEPTVLALASGAEARIRNGDAPRAAVLVNGGTARRVPGTWSATSEWLALRLSRQFPEIALVEVRYRTKSWHALPACIEDAGAALDLLERPAMLVGFSMGGAVAIGAAVHAQVGPVLGLAPWIPPELDFAPLADRRFDVVHGAWDRWLPGIPGVSPAHSRAGFERARAAGASGTYTLIPRGLHGVAVRSRRGLVTLPGASRWLGPVSAALARFEGPSAAQSGEREYHRSVVQGESTPR
jgi:pimeloyl-ACP methyl ester carboxylesterase